MQKLQKRRLVPVGVGLVRTIHLHTDVIGLLLAQSCHVSPQCGQMQSRNLLVQLLWQQVYVVFVSLRLFPVLEDVQLRKNLVRERARHDKGWMTGGTAEVTQAPRCQNDDAMSVREHRAVHLRLNILDLDTGELLEKIHLNLVIEMADIANNCIVLHLLHVFQPDNLKVAGGRDEDVNLADNRLHCCYLEAFHASLQRANGIDLSNHDTCAASLHGMGAALANIAKAADQGTLATDHNISGAHDGVWK